MRGLLYLDSYRPLFSGHETFALRQLWLKKAIDVVGGDQNSSRQNNHGSTLSRGHKKNVFSDDASIVTLGVGKNMVASIRHWATACDVLTDINGVPTSTMFGARVFADDGLDPYSEHPSTLWLVHWKLAGGWSMQDRTHRSATWYWVFNHIHEQSFTAKSLLKSLDDYARDRGGRLSPATLKRDVEVCMRCYVDRSETSSVDDFADSMLGELGLISAQSREEYALRRGPKSTLTNGAFLYALVEFWQAFAPDQSTLSFETIAYEIGSPGRVFKLDEDSVAARLIALESLTKGAYQWSDSAGLRQVIRTQPLDLASALELAYV
ncbi:DUF4007 family protein [Diaphorobacter sp. HDW4B]|uniref:DUF4007 family protein n=1 Tax=Diaphorobacter sp. HDW4B TaxID=2714925 RepID=UPI001409DBFB|nr:DUF4007 family protein [Diaphorobacter sp. HDW4B]QIL69101.1 DUF4007 family protein [Diaphorobacter sp. HDW4B]